jgi:glycosyltransferase involved in cell wall biosynthesis
MVERIRITILMPTFNDWQAAVHLIPAIDKMFGDSRFSLSFLIMDDASTDLSHKIELHSLKLKCTEFIEVIELVCNQGNQRAIAIGLGYAAKNVTCDYLCVMDSDHEDRPEDVAELIRACQTQAGPTIVFAERAERSEGPIFRICYIAYKWLFRLATGRVISFGNFCAIPSALVLRVAHLKALWVHFSAAIIHSRILYARIPTSRGKRFSGNATTNLVSLANHAFNALVIFADVLSMRLILAVLALAIVVFLAVFVITLLYFFTDIFIQGWASVIIGLLMTFLMEVFAFSVLINFMAAIGRLNVQLPAALNFADYILRIERIPLKY